MKKEIKAIIIGAILCVCGGIILDTGYEWTGGVLLIIGAIFMLFGPLAVIEIN